MIWPFSKSRLQHGSASADVKLAVEPIEMPLPAELALYFEAVGTGGYAELYEVEVHLLDRVQSERHTRAISSHPIIHVLQGLVLDDPQTSNHHIYLRHPGLAGCILFLSHDGDTRIVYSSLAKFMEAVNLAKHEKSFLTGFHPLCAPRLKDQEALSGLISTLITDKDVEDEAVVVALIPSRDLRDKALLSRLVLDENFFFGEAVAIEIDKRPSIDLLSVAELCAGQGHVQIRNAGQRALAAIGQLVNKESGDLRPGFQ